MTTNTPIDEYLFWKSLIEEKKSAGEVVSSDMCELLAMAEAQRVHFLTEHADNEDKRRIEYMKSLVAEHNEKAKKVLSKVGGISTQVIQ